MILTDYLVLDCRGNHDNFDVPGPESERNYYRQYGAGGGGSYLTVLTHHRAPLAFLGLDTTLRPGPRRPFNFVGALDQEGWNRAQQLATIAEREAEATVWFGHYPRYRCSLILFLIAIINDVRINDPAVRNQYLCHDE